MRVPTEEELAAIAAAYLIVTRESAPPREASACPELVEGRWKLAARLESVGENGAPPRTSVAGRWKLAGRVDG